MFDYLPGTSIPHILTERLGDRDPPRHAIFPSSIKILSNEEGKDPLRIGTSGFGVKDSCVQATMVRTHEMLEYVAGCADIKKVLVTVSERIGPMELVIAHFPWSRFRNPDTPEEALEGVALRADAEVKDLNGIDLRVSIFEDSTSSLYVGCLLGR